MGITDGESETLYETTKRNQVQNRSWNRRFPKSWVYPCSSSMWCSDFFDVLPKKNKPINQRGTVTVHHGLSHHGKPSRITRWMSPAFSKCFCKSPMTSCWQSSTSRFFPAGEAGKVKPCCISDHPKAGKLVTYVDERWLSVTGKTCCWTLYKPRTMAMGRHCLGNNLSIWDGMMLTQNFEQRQ